MLDTPPSVLTTCETDFLSYETFDCACISYGVLLAVIPICFALGFITKALRFWVLCRIAVLLLSFGSALSLSIWMLRRCPTCFQFLLAALVCCVCSRVLLLLLQVGFRFLHSSHSSRVPLVLRCILSGWNKDKTSQGKGFCYCSLVRCLMYLPFQVWGFCALAAASSLHVHQVISLPAAACEAFLRIFALEMHESSSWLGTLGGHDVFVPVFIMLLSVIIEGFIAMLAMALVVCFFSGKGSAQEPDASSLAVCWKDIGHVLGLRIVGLGCGGCQARGLSVAWLAQATPRVDVAIVPFRFLENLKFLVVLFALVRNMSLVMCDKFVQATDELQQQAAAALATMTLSPRWGPRLAWQVQATPRVDVAEVSFASSGLMGSGTKKMKDPSPALPEFIDSVADPAFQIFVVLFSGRSRCVMVRASWGVSKLVDIVAELSEVPAQHFYLTCGGKILKEQDKLCTVSVDCRVLMHGRLEGGVRTIIPGEWSCTVCGAQGCWPTRRSCYKCGSMKTASPVQLGSFVNGYKGHFREQNGLGRPLPPVAPAPAPVPVVVPPRLTKSQKRAARQSAAVPPSPAPAGQNTWDAVLKALVNIGLDDSVLGKIREKIPVPPPVEKKKERHLADLRDKRDKAQRVLDRLVEDAEKKKVLYEEACTKVNSQRVERDDLERQVEAARVQVNLPTPPPTLPSDDGDWEQGEESGFESSVEEATRDVEAGLGMDVDGSSRKRGRTRGRSRSPAFSVHATGRGRSRPLTPPQPSTPNPSELDSLSPEQLAILIRHANKRAEAVRQQIGEENWERLNMLPPAPSESG